VSIDHTSHFLAGGPLVVFDGNNDMHPDLIARGIGPDAQLFTNQGDGTFDGGVSRSVPHPIDFAASGDFDNDEKLDAVTVDPSGASRSRGSGRRTAALPVT
jgi:hypothetical protein